MSTDEVIRKAEARRAKLLQQKELRMNKILLGSKSVDEDEIKVGKENRLINPAPKNSDNFIKEILTQPEETQLTQRKTDGAHFPRKVSLISSPANFKTLQQNQANKDGFLPVYIYSFVISLHHYAYALLPLFSLIFFAVIGSFVQYNFLIPFLASQLVRIVHAFYNSPNGLAIKFTDVVSAIISHLIIFCTFYIVISVSRQKIYSY